MTHGNCALSPDATDPETGGRTELGSTYTVRLKVTDAGGLSHTQIFTIAEGTVTIDGDYSGTSQLLAEDSHSGTPVYIGVVDGSTALAAHVAGDNNNDEFVTGIMPRLISRASAA